MEKIFKTIAVMTSGYEAPSMNNAIRAVVRTAIVKRIIVFAINGWREKQIYGLFGEVNAKSVINIIRKSGTIIYTSRGERFRKILGRRVVKEQF